MIPAYKNVDEFDQPTCQVCGAKKPNDCGYCDKCEDGYCQEHKSSPWARKR